MGLLRPLLVALTVSAAVVSVWSLPPRTTSKRAPFDGSSVVYLVADALRADHVGCYGYRRDTTPFVDRLAQRAIVFRNLKSTASWTLPSMATHFTGQHPMRFFKIGEKLPDDLVFVTEVLKRAGYHTYGISGNPHLREHTNFIQGFDEFHYVDWGGGPASSLDGRQLNLFLRTELLPRMKRPFFLWLHYMDVHSPYRPPRSFAQKFGRTLEEIRGHDVPGLSGWFLLKDEERTAMKGRDLRLATDLYDAEIGYWDSLVEEVYDWLRYEGDTLWVIASDHGDEFRDHFGTGHGVSLYEELLSVPLIIHSPGLPGRIEVGARHSTVDIMPSLLELLGLRIEELPLDGHSVFTDVEHASPAYATLEAISPRRSTTLRTVYEGRWKYIHDYGAEVGELYDLTRDPRERANVSAARPRVAETLRTDLEAYRAEVEGALAGSSGKVGSVDAETLERLRVLGYATEEQSSAAPPARSEP